MSDVTPMDDLERMLRDAMPVNRREVAEIIQGEVDRIEARLEALENTPVPVYCTDCGTDCGKASYHMDGIRCPACFRKLVEEVEGQREREDEEGWTSVTCAKCGQTIEPTETFRFVAQVRDGKAAYTVIHAECPEPAMSTDEAEPTPTDTPRDTPTPEPGEPKVVGYVSEPYLGASVGSGTILKAKEFKYPHPVILLSDHEAVVRGLREHRSDLYQEHLSVIADLGRVVREKSDLKAENERLTEELSEATRQCRHWEKAANDTTITASRQLQERNDEIDRLRKGRDTYREAAQAAMRERDAYADPGNWEVVNKDTGIVLESRQLTVRHIGPTPSDTEAESVEGEVSVGVGRRGYVLLPRDSDWDPGAPVRITRIPTPGGDE